MSIIPFWYIDIVSEKLLCEQSKRWTMKGVSTETSCRGGVSRVVTENQVQDWFVKWGVTRV